MILLPSVKKTEPVRKEKAIKIVYCLYRVSTKNQVDHNDIPMDKLLSDIKEQGMVGVHLITANEGFLQSFYERFGFSKEKRVMLMGREL